MSVSRIYWRFFLLDPASMLAYFVDTMGNVQTGSVFTGQDRSLPQSPGNWDGMELSFGRNSHYWGINRSFSTPFKFIGDGATIIRSLLYSGRGIESTLALVICKWDDVTGVFRLYCSGLLDLSKADDLVAEGITVNIMEGGAAQYIKAYENTIVEIPCDGSIPENIKINADGIEFTDTFHYEFPAVASPIPGDQPIPCNFITNDGDNIGVTHADQQLDPTIVTTPGYLQQSNNYGFISEEPIKGMQLEGLITVKSDFRVTNTEFYMHTATTLSQPRGIGGTDHAIGLVTPFVPAPGGFWAPVNSQLNVNGQVTFALNATIDLDANEGLFLFFFNNFADRPIQIVGGQFSLTFNSRYRASRIWCMTMYDLGRKVVEALNALSSNFLQTFNFGFDSNFLRARLNWLATSGDAVRASTDPNYFQYFNQATLNPSNPNNQFYEQFSFQGPSIKTTLSDFFDAVNPVGSTALSNQLLPGESESIFLEGKGYVLDHTVITMSLTKIANFRVSIALEYYFNWLKIGYQPQQYDEKAGKYEYNSLMQWQAPIKTVAKVLELICKYRADSYGFEYTRWNTQGGKSTTFNNSDSDVWMLNADFANFVFDFFRANFTSGIPDPMSATNGDQKLLINQAYQPVIADSLDGEYFISNNDFAIFVLNDPIVSVSKTVNVVFTILLNGLLGDRAIVKMWVNGIVFQQWSQNVTGVNTAFNVIFNTSRNFTKGDCIYFTIDTIKTCTGTITSFQLNVGSGYFTCFATGVVTIDAGQSEQLINLPVITPTTNVINGRVVPNISYGFQYFQFLSPVHDTEFRLDFSIAGFVQGGGSDKTSFDVWHNGVILFTSSNFPGTTGITPFNAPHATLFATPLIFSQYDLIWVTGSVSNMSSWIAYMDLKFTSGSIKAYNLNRPSLTPGASDNSAYSNISGVPNPSSAFNIPEFTPKAMLEANAPLLASTLFPLAPQQLTFQTADKNQLLSTTKDGVTITENANVDIHDLGNPLFYPFVFEFDTEVPINFADLFTNAANGHIEFIYNNKTFYGFPILVTAKPALNESQSWKLLCSPKTNLSDLIDLDWDGLTPLMPLDISIPIICPLHVVPLNFVKDSVYKNNTMDQDFYENRIAAWIDQQNYAAPRQNNEPVPIQLQTNGLSPVSIQVLDSKGVPVGAPVNIPSIIDPSVNPAQTLFQGSVPLNTLADGIYYTLWSIGSGEGTGMLITEGIHVKADWDYNTIRLDYKNTRNKLATVFTTQPGFNIRVHGQINRYTPKSKFTTFVDQPQDIDLLNAIPYDTWKLEIGRSSGIPDYMMRKIARIFDLNTVLIDGDQYTRDADAQWEQQTTPGQPKAYMTLDIRRAKNIDAITMNTSGQLTSDMSGGYTLDPTAFGAGPGQPLIEVGS